MAQVNFTTPVGRMIRGSLYKPRTQDAEGKPLVVKSGPNVGQARVDFYFEIAIPKEPGQTHWAQKPANWPAGKPYWGEIIWGVGHAAFPQGQAQLPSFAWKVYDGDSQIPNKAGKKPCDIEGAKGNWVIRFSSGYAPKIFNADGTAAIVEPDAVKPGYYIQVNGNVDGNNSMQQPGVFVSHSMVALAGYGPEIITGPDPAAAGFGQAPLPPGVSATPVGQLATPAPLGHVPPVGVPQAGVMPVPAPATGAPTANLSNPAFLGVPPGVPGVPGVPTMMPAVPQVPAQPVRQMTALAQGATYEQLVANGWTDALLIQHGLMVQS